MSSHASNAKKFIKKGKAHVRWHDKALWFVREKRDKQAHSIKNWEDMRDVASQIKTHTLANLPKYLEEFEKNAREKGAVIHWAKDAKEHNEIVYNILKENNAKKVVKSKSMLTEECGLNSYLEKRKIEVVDTDLGERIIQLAKEAPSHIVLPAIHKRKEEVGILFHKHLGTEEGASDPSYLTEAARQHLRQKFLSADAGISGVNFAVAETGGLTLVTNEGNADLGNSLPKLHIASMGIEKVIPTVEDLSLFVRMLSRNATGQSISTYTSHLLGPRAGGILHIVIVDNGRADILKTKDFWQTLKCIRCGACLNTCPVYRRSGGHSYEYTTPGPIGILLAMHRDIKKHKSLPYACTLCGSCTAVCSVRVDLDNEILKWRFNVVKAGKLGLIKRVAMAFAGFAFLHTWAYDFGGFMARLFTPIIPKFLLHNPLVPWGRTRDIPPLRGKNFKALYKKKMKEEAKKAKRA